VTTCQRNARRTKSFIINDSVATVPIDQNVNMGRFTSLCVFVFDTTARVELSSNGVEFWRCVAFDAVTFVPVVNAMAVTDVSIIPPLTSVGQSTAICVAVTNEGSQREENVSVKAFVDGAPVGAAKYMSLDPGLGLVILRPYCGFHVLRKIILSEVRLGLVGQVNSKVYIPYTPN